MANKLNLVATLDWAKFQSELQKQVNFTIKQAEVMTQALKINADLSVKGVNINSQLDDMKKVSDALKLQQQQQKLTQEQYRTEYQKTRVEQKKFNQTILDVKASQAKAREEYSQSRLRIQQLREEKVKTKTQNKLFSDSIWKIIHGYNSVSAAIRFSIGFIRDSGRAINNATKSYREFEKGLLNVNSLISASPQKLNLYSQRLIEAGKNAGDIQGTTKAAYNAVSILGERALQSANFMDLMGKASVAGLASMNDSVELTAAYIRGMNIDISRTPEILNQAFTTVKLGKTTFSELASNIQKVTSQALTLNLEMSDINSVFATLTGVTGNTNRVATQFSGIMRAITKPTQQAKDMAAQLGIEFNAAALQSMGFSNFLEMVKNSTNGNIESLSKLFGNTNALKGMVALTGSQFEKFNANLLEIQTNNNSLAEAFNVNSNSMDYLIKVLAQSWEALKIQVISGVAPALKDLIKVGISLLATLYQNKIIVNSLDFGLSAFGNTIKSINDLTEKQIKVTSTSLATLGFLTIAFKINSIEQGINMAAKEANNLATDKMTLKQTIASIATGYFTKSLKALTISLKATATGASGLFGIFTVLAAGFTLYINQVKEYGSTWQNMQVVITASIMATWELIKNFGNNVKIIAFGIKDVFVNGFIDIKNNAISIFKDIGKFIIAALTGDIETLQESFKNLFSPPDAQSTISAGKAILDDLATQHKNTVDTIDKNTEEVYNSIIDLDEIARDKFAQPIDSELFDINKLNAMFSNFTSPNMDLEVGTSAISDFDNKQSSFPTIQQGGGSDFAVEDPLLKTQDFDFTSQLESQIKFYEEMKTYDNNYWNARFELINFNLAEETNLSDIQKQQLAELRWADLENERLALLEKEKITQEKLALGEKEWEYQKQLQDAIAQNQIEKIDLVTGYANILASTWSDAFSSIFDNSKNATEKVQGILNNLKNNIIKFIGDIIAKKITAIILESALSKTSQATAIATGAATGSALAASYAPAAAMASLASFGGNAVPAQAGIAATVGIAKGLTLFAEGGYTGTSNNMPDSTGEKPAGIVHEKEFVFERNIVDNNLQGLQELRKLLQKGVKVSQIMNPMMEKDFYMSSFAEGGYVDNSNSNIMSNMDTPDFIINPQIIANPNLDTPLENMSEIRTSNTTTDTNLVDLLAKKLDLVIDAIVNNPNVNVAINDSETPEVVRKEDFEGLYNEYRNKRISRGA